MAIIIGKTGKNVQKEHAMDYVFGYTAAHDVSARDWQLRKNGGQWLLGKTMDGFCPLGILFSVSLLLNIAALWVPLIMHDMSFNFCNA